MTQPRKDSVFFENIHDKNLEDWREQRRRIAHRKRRIVYNNDGDEIWFEGIDTCEKFLDLRTTAVLGSQVDTVTR